MLFYFALKLHNDIPWLPRFPFLPREPLLPLSPLVPPPPRGPGGPGGPAGPRGPGCPKKSDRKDVCICLSASISCETVARSM